MGRTIRPLLFVNPQRSTRAFWGGTLPWVRANDPFTAQAHSKDDGRLLAG